MAFVFFCSLLDSFKDIIVYNSRYFGNCYNKFEESFCKKHISISSSLLKTKIMMIIDTNHVNL